ncbi:YchJ family protein [Halomonas sp. YLGW01]|uniref:YchJ family protein n=1 Tax=Halomonas sp. YLGW01 TaxID=2773308 RepID=UPI001785891C|nr:YchJ family protein [Halomonas sp. YLGW01]
MALSTTAVCPCGSGETYGECCAPLHQGVAAETVVSLMRSRYSAFVLRLEGYLRKSWHPDTCPAEMGLSGATHWKRLEVLEHDQQDGEQEQRGWVHFRATFQEHGRWQQLEEASRFIRLDGRWVYVDGDARVTALKPGRNDPCPCDSGRKLKKCCAV